MEGEMAEAKLEKMKQADDLLEKWLSEIGKSKVKATMACSALPFAIFSMWLICRLIWGF
jgi:hypothetical protein